jgi:hypothetical protein
MHAAKYFYIACGFEFLGPRPADWPRDLFPNPCRAARTVTPAPAGPLHVLARARGRRLLESYVEQLHCGSSQPRKFLVYIGMDSYGTKLVDVAAKGYDDQGSDELQRARNIAEFRAISPNRAEPGCQWSPN